MSEPKPTAEPFRSVLGAVSICLVILLAVAATKSYRDLALANQRYDELERQLAETEERVAALKGRIEGLRSDAGTLERLAREDLLMARPGEVVILVPDEQPSPDHPGPE